LESLDDRRNFIATCAILAELSTVPSIKVMTCTRESIKEIARKLTSKEGISAAKKKESQNEMVAVPQDAEHKGEWPYVPSNW
jgi:hypothetical protein